MGRDEIEVRCEMEIKKDTVTVIVAALNEERTLEAAVETARRAGLRRFGDVQIVIVDDGSTDETGAIADRLAASVPGAVVVHHERSRNLGGAYQSGIRRAFGEYLILINGKDDTPEDALDQIFSLSGRADMVIPHTLNPNERPWFRRICSRTFTALLNGLSGHRLRYYNHSVLHRTALVRDLPIATPSYAVQAEIVLRLLGQDASFVEVGVRDRFRSRVRTKAFRIANVVGVARFLGAVARGDFLGVR